MGDDGEIDLVLAEPRQQIDRQVANDVDMHERMALPEAREDRRKESDGVFVNRPQTHRALQLGLQQGGQRLPMRVEDATRMAEEELAIGAKTDGPPFTEEHRPSEQLLETLDLH